MAELDVNSGWLGFKEQSGLVVLSCEQPIAPVASLVAKLDKSLELIVWSLRNEAAHPIVRAASTEVDGLSARTEFRLSSQGSRGLSWTPPLIVSERADRDVAGLQKRLPDLTAGRRSLWLLEYLYDVSHEALVAGGRATSRVSDDHDAVVVRHRRKDEACQLRIGRIGEESESID